MEASWETEEHDESCVCFGNPFAARHYCDCKISRAYQAVRSMLAESQGTM